MLPCCEPCDSEDCSLKHKIPSSATGHRHNEFPDPCCRPLAGITCIWCAKMHGSAETRPGSQQRGRVTDLGCHQCPLSHKTLVPGRTPTLLFIALLSPAGGGAMSVYLAEGWLSQRLKNRLSPRELAGRTETDDFTCSRSQRSTCTQTMKRDPSKFWVPLLELPIPGGSIIFRGTLYIFLPPTTRSLLFPDFQAIPIHCRDLCSNPSSDSY